METVDGTIYALVHRDEPLRYRYIGLTTQTPASSRLNFHRWAARRGDRSAYSWMRKHGDWAIEMVVLEKCATVDQLRDTEVRWIALLRGPRSDILNLTTGGEGTSGYVPSPEKNAAQALRMTGSANPFFGKTHGPEARARMSLSHTGQPANRGTTGMTWSPEIREKIAASVRGTKRDIAWYHAKFHVRGQSLDTIPGCPQCLDAKVEPLEPALAPQR